MKLQKRLNHELTKYQKIRPKLELTKPMLIYLTAHRY